MLYLKKLKTILPLKLLILLLITAFYVSYKINNINESKYKISDNSFEGIITDINKYDDKVTFELNGLEKLLVNYYLEEKFNFQVGDRVSINGILSLPSSNDNFNLFNYKNYLLSKKINYVLEVENINLIEKNNSILYKLKSLIIYRIDSIKNNSYLKAFILGNSKYIDDNIKSIYQSIGVSHLFAVSGMHISFLTSMLLFILKRINTKISNVIVLIFLLFYTFLTNASPSILRAVLFYILLLIKKGFKLKVSTFNLFMILVCLFLIYNPYYLYHTGFLYSFTISGFLIFFQGKLKGMNYFKSLLGVSYISFLASLPITLYNSFNINIFSIVLNLFFVPLVSLIIFPLSFLVFIFPFLNNIFLFLINIMEMVATYAYSYTLNLTFAKPCLIIIMLYYLLIILSLKNSYYLIILFLTLLVHYNIRLINKYPIMTMIDVGQGDSILIELPRNKSNILIDTGGIMTYDGSVNHYVSDSIIIPYLKSLGIKSINYLIITHGDYDHIGEAENLINKFKINSVVMNSGSNNYLESNLIDLLNNKSIEYKFYNKNKLLIDKYSFEFINDKNSLNENEDSLIIRTQLNNKNILLMGDAGKISEYNLLKEYNLDKVDILKVGHHGSKNSSSIDFINKISPTYSLISVGTNNRFNHPSKEAIDILSKNSKIYKTSEYGSIRIILNDQLKILCSTFNC